MGKLNRCKPKPSRKLDKRNSRNCSAENCSQTHQGKTVRVHDPKTGMRGYAGECCLESVFLQGGWVRGWPKPKPRRKPAPFRRWRVGCGTVISNEGATLYVVGNGSYSHDCVLAKRLASLLNRHRVVLPRSKP